jgi:hypothetical protein
MKNRFRTVALAALLVAGLVGGCANDGKSGMMDDKGMEKSNRAMDKGMMKHCAKCGMECDANGMCPHCDAPKMMK